MALDAASNGNFSTNTEEEALQKIENLAASDNNQFTEYDRTSRSAPADTRRMEELISKMEQLVKKESRAPVHMCEGESSRQDEEEVFQAEMNYINGQGQGNRGFNPNLRYNNNLSYRSNNVENPQDQYYPPQRNAQQFQQRPYEQKSGNFNQGRFQQNGMNQGRSNYQQPYQAPPVDKLDEIKNLVQHFTKTFDEKLDAMARTIDEFSTEHREKFEVMQNQIRNVENQIAQTAAAVQRPAGTLPGKPDQNPRDKGKNFCSFVRKPDAEQQEENYWDEALTDEYLEENFGERYLPEGEELIEETEEEILSIATYTTPVRTLNSFSETLVDEIFYVYTEEFGEHSAQPIQTQHHSNRK